MRTLLLLIAFLSGLQFSAQTIVKNVDALTFKKYVDAKKAQLIDLRTTDELQRKGMISGATQIDWFEKDAEKKIASLDRKKTYLVYCAGGGRSGECAELMTKLGFKEVINLETGYDDWKKKGLPTVPYSH